MNEENKQPLEEEQVPQTQAQEAQQPQAEAAAEGEKEEKNAKAKKKKEKGIPLFPWWCACGSCHTRR